MLRLHGEKNLKAGWVLIALGGLGAALYYAQVTWRGGASWEFCEYMPVVLAVLGGLVSVAFGLSIDRAVLRESTKAAASWTALAAAAAMPAGCLVGAAVPPAHAVLPVFAFALVAALAVLAKGFLVPCGDACCGVREAGDRREDDSR